VALPEPLIHLSSNRARPGGKIGGRVVVQHRWLRGAGASTPRTVRGNHIIRSFLLAYPVEAMHS
jgi:hypothetical protein